MYFPKILHPHSKEVKLQTLSEGFKKPFYFGGSQVPIALGIRSDATPVEDNIGQNIKSTYAGTTSVPIGRRR